MAEPKTSTEPTDQRMTKWTWGPGCATCSWRWCPAVCVWCRGLDAMIAGDRA
jgi:hypothetical protein